MIIDATELNTQVPCALQKHSETYSTSKSHTTLNCLLSQLFEGPISDKQIVERSEFLEILGQKLIAG